MRIGSGREIVLTVKEDFLNPEPQFEIAVGDEFRLSLTASEALELSANLKALVERWKGKRGP